MALSTLRNRFTTGILWLLLALALLAPSAEARNVGMYFGTFDPIHTGHIKVAERSVELLNLDVLYLIPNPIPRGKPQATGFDARRDMVSLVVRRHAKFQTLPAAFLQSVQQADSLTTVDQTIRYIQSLEGSESRYYHICGTDSFLKMLDYQRFPTEQENRVVVVMSRPGYEYRSTDSLKGAIEKGKVLFLDPQTHENNSTRLRNLMALGKTPDPNDLPAYIWTYIQRNGLYQTHRPEPAQILVQPDGYECRDLTINDAPASYSEAAISDLIDPNLLFSPLTLDIDQYLRTRIPLAIREFILIISPRLYFLPCPLAQALPIISALGYQQGKLFQPIDTERIQNQWFLSWKDGEPALFVTNMFGLDRIRHSLLQYGNLLSRNLIPLSRLTVLRPSPPVDLTRQFCQESLAGLQAQPGDLVVIGYQGSLNIVLADWAKYLEKHPASSFAKVPLAALDAIHEKYGNTHLTYPQANGTPMFPWWQYSIQGLNGRGQRVISFRNSYGDQTEILIRELLERGFHRLVLLGNAGGFKDVEIGKLYAPLLATDGQRTWTLPNQARRWFPGRLIATAFSPLMETEAWMAEARRFSMVDVETVPAARALEGHPEVRLFAGLLISDLPGTADITQKDEDSPLFISSKRRFFYEALRWWLTNPEN